MAHSQPMRPYRENNDWLSSDDECSGGDAGTTTKYPSRRRRPAASNVSSRSKRAKQTVQERVSHQRGYNSLDSRRSQVALMEDDGNESEQKRILRETVKTKIKEIEEEVYEAIEDYEQVFAGVGYSHASNCGELDLVVGDTAAILRAYEVRIFRWVLEAFKLVLNHKYQIGEMDRFDPAALEGVYGLIDYMGSSESLRSVNFLPKIGARFLLVDIDVAMSGVVRENGGNGTVISMDPTVLQHAIASRIRTLYGLTAEELDDVNIAQSKLLYGGKVAMSHVAGNKMVAIGFKDVSRQDRCAASEHINTVYGNIQRRGEGKAIFGTLQGTSSTRGEDRDVRGIARKLTEPRTIIFSGVTPDKLRHNIQGPRGSNGTARIPRASLVSATTLSMVKGGNSWVAGHNVASMHHEQTLQITNKAVDAATKMWLHDNFPLMPVFSTDAESGQTMGLALECHIDQSMQVHGGGSAHSLGAYVPNSSGDDGEVGVSVHLNRVCVAVPYAVPIHLGHGFEPENFTINFAEAQLVGRNFD